MNKWGKKSQTGIVISTKHKLANIYLKIADKHCLMDYGENYSLLFYRGKNKRYKNLTKAVKLWMSA